MCTMILFLILWFQVSSLRKTLFLQRRIAAPSTVWCSAVFVRTIGSAATAMARAKKSARKKKKIGAKTERDFLTPTPTPPTPKTKNRERRDSEFGGSVFRTTFWRQRRRKGNEEFGRTKFRFRDKKSVRDLIGRWQHRIRRKVKVSSELQLQHQRHPVAKVGHFLQSARKWLFWWIMLSNN